MRRISVAAPPNRAVSPRCNRGIARRSDAEEDVAGLAGRARPVLVAGVAGPSRASADPLRIAAVRSLQQTQGNQAVQRLIARIQPGAAVVQRDGDDETEEKFEALPGEFIEGKPFNLKDKTLAGVGTDSTENPNYHITQEDLDAVPAETKKLLGWKYTKLKAMEKKYRGETDLSKNAEGFNTKYLKEAGREPFRLKFEGGSVKRRDEAFSTTSMKSNWSEADDGTAMYVMDNTGSIFAGSQNVGRFHHSSFMAGGPVAAAGEMSLNAGTLKYINNFSGHYLPTPDHLTQVLQELRDNAVPLNIPAAVKYKGNDEEIHSAAVPADAFLTKAESNGLPEILPHFGPAQSQSEPEEGAA
ncbi:MAG TPA: hypothetical protein VH482_04750 [Thermomicrobiales bacterium]